MASQQSFDLVDSIIDEVALEGLDGITLEALWLRLANRFHESVPLPRPFMEQVWSVCIQVRPFTFYQLKVPRKQLVLIDRYEFVDPDIGTILEPDDVPEDIYPHCPIDDRVTGNRGSCSTYHSRKDISSTVKKWSLEQATEKYGQSLVIVANQAERERALMGDTVCPTLELTVMQYCFLERVGRSRYHGEVTQGKLSLNCLKEDPKTLFYHRKYLLRHKLITKQMHHQKSVSSGHSCSGSLLHLPRFYVERKPKVIFLAEQVIDILRSKENCLAEYKEIKKALQLEGCIKKLFKTAFFYKVIKADLKVPYRTLYPDAEVKEWQHKNHPPNEKVIRAVQLVDPNVDINELWNKDEIHEEEDPFEMEISHHKYSVPFLKQANVKVEDTKRDGICQGELSREMGLTKLQSRTILRNLVKANLVATFMNDMGRQRLTKYVSKKFEKSSKLSKQFEKEMDKIRELTKAVAAKVEVESRVAPQTEGRKDEVVRTGVDGPSVLVDAGKTPMDELPLPAAKPSPEVGRTFNTANRIIRKYRLSKYANKYRRTYIGSIGKSVRTGQGRKVRRIKSNATTTTTITTTTTTTTQVAPSLSAGSEALSMYNSVKTSLIVEKPQNVGKAIDEAFSFIEDKGKRKEKKDMSNITYRLLRRANMIIESIKEHQIIDDTTKLLKMISEEEDKEGYDVKIDKKSLLRLLGKLAKDNVIKIIKLTLSGNGREKHSTFICDPTIDTGHTVIQSAVEQAKVKFCLTASSRAKSSNPRVRETGRPGTQQESPTKGSTGLDEGTNSNSKGSEEQKGAPSYRSNSKIGKTYGYGPKFVRMKVMHLLLYYLAYEHPGEQSLPKEAQIRALEEAGHTVPRKLRDEMSTVYKTEVGWKMFVPPLPVHAGWPRGWALMCDVLLRMPLSIFLKVHNVTFVIPELESYTRHPIRKHFLVKDLPLSVRNALLYARKYIFNIHQTVTKLCYVGLVQFGPQRLKEKDQVFVYVNRRTELLDTTSSAPNYHKTEDKVYPVTKYTFDEIGVVEKYWYDMWNVCVNTPLGGRLVVQGKDILLEELEKKAEMIEAAKARSPEEAADVDKTGRVPGDRRGAAGIDSAFFSHLKRNWDWLSRKLPSSSSWSSQRKQRHQQQSIGGAAAAAAAESEKPEGERAYQRQAYLAQIKVKPFKFTEFAGLKKVTGPSTMSAQELRRAAAASGSRERERERERENSAAGGERKSPTKHHQVLTSQRSSRQRTFVRRVMPRKPRVRTRTKYDEIDCRALQRMQKLRVDWEPHEDNLLLVCKIAMSYLCPNPRKQLVSFSAVRDFLRSSSSSSYNKTSRACQRRLLYMMKRRDAANSVTLGLEEMKQNWYISKRFEGAAERIKAECEDPAEQEARVSEAFKELVSYIAKKYFDLSEIGPKEPMALPRTAQEFNLYCRVLRPAKPLSGERAFFRDVRNADDISSATINTVIHSSMCCGKDRRSWAYQLFKVYQWYPEALLRNAMAKIRADQMVTVKKSHACVQKWYGNCVPMSCSQYQLSTYYAYKFHTKWPYGLFREAYDVFEKLLAWYDAAKEDTRNGTEIHPVTGGTVIAVHDYMLTDQLDMDIEIPDQIIMLDPRLNEKDETYLRIAKRYQDILASLDRPAAGQSEQREEVPVEGRERREQPAVVGAGSIGGRKRPLADKQDDTRSYGEPLAKRKRSCGEGSVVEEDSDSVDAAGRLYEGGYTRVSDIVRNAAAEGDWQSSYPKLDDTSDIEKRYTRIALLRMREELNELTVADSHHAHDLFVVNMCKILYSLKSKSTDSSAGTDLIPLAQDTVDRLIESISAAALFPKNSISYAECKATKLRDASIGWAKFDAVYKYVREKKEVGASAQELKDKFYKNLGRDLYQVTSLLTKHHVFLRSGVTAVRYIHHRFANPWLIRSYRIHRLDGDGRRRDSSEAVATSGTIEDIVDAGPSSHRHSELVRCSESEEEEEEEEENENENENDSDASSKVQTSSRTCLLPQKEVCMAARQLDFTTAEEIRVSMKPWIRVDGALNRKVLDRMLGAVLTYCLTHPGVTLAKVQNRFVPALQPFHARELVEILVALGCLERKHLAKARVTLFSKPAQVELKPADEWTNEEDTILEPAPSATLKFSIFLNKESDHTDFIP